MEEKKYVLEVNKMELEEICSGLILDLKISALDSKFVHDLSLIGDLLRRFYQILLED